MEYVWQKYKALKLPAKKYQRSCIRELEIQVNHLGI